MDHRRRAADFSHLLDSFGNNTTDCGSALEAVTQETPSSTETNVQTTCSEQTYDENKRMNTKISNKADSSDSGSFVSTILAGQAAESDSQRTSESSYQTARSGSLSGRPKFFDFSLESCRQAETQSTMNRAIPLEFSPQPELDLSQTTAEPRSSGEMNKNIVSPSDKSSNESRDRNYNIKRTVKEIPPESKASEIRKIPQSPRNKFGHSTPRAFSAKRKDWTVLSSLDNVLDPAGDKTRKSKQDILRRLSQEFHYSPRTFTERLVTIIDESETGFADADATGVNLSRMTKEFRKMCKFIQDESMPEMAPSLCMNSILGNSKYHDDDKHPNYERPETIVESPTESPSVDCKTPQMDLEVQAKKIYRKTPLNIFRKTFPESKASPGSPNNTREFEYWEKYCESLPESPIASSKKRPKTLRRSLSTSDISEAAKEELLQKCEEQLRLLDDTCPVAFETFDSHRGPEVKEGEIEVESKNRNATHVEKEATEAHRSCDNFEEIDEDELSESLMMEKELQRQRCFETAIVMQEIEEDTKKTKEEYPKALERRGIDPETAFMRTINSCLAYKNCLSSIRQSSHPKRKESASADSGIDTRSFGRTLYASSKKSFNEASARNSQRSNERSAAISSKLSTGAVKKTKAASSSSLLRENTNRKISPRRNAGALRPTTKSAVMSRSPSRGKLTPAKSATMSRSPSRGKLTPTKSAATLRSPSREKLTPTKSAAMSPSPSRGKLTPSGQVSTSKYRTLNIPEKSRQGVRVKSPVPSISVIPPINRRDESPVLSSSPSARNSSRERIPKLMNAATLLPGKSPAATAIAKSPRYRYFVTPGRNTSVVKKRKTKPYFTNIDEVQQASSPRVMKSLHAPGLYRLGYKTVISPVSMYIRGTDVNLIQNVHERKDEFLLTPRKAASEEELKYNLASKASPRNSPRTQCRLFVDEEGSNSDEQDENLPKFELPKSTYNPPAQVRTVHESPKLVGGARRKGLLQSMQNRVVIRHEGRTREKLDDNNVPENSSDAPVDMSIHVMRSAEKTNFMRNRRH